MSSHQHGSHVEAELHHVAVGHDVVLALDADLAGRLGGGHGSGGDEVVEGDDLGLDEALLEVGVNDAGRLGRGVALVNRPRAGLFRARGEVGLQAQGVEAGARQRVQTRLGLADGLEQLRRPIRRRVRASSDSIFASRNTASAGATDGVELGDLARRRSAPTRRR